MRLSRERQECLVILSTGEKKRFSGFPFKNFGNDEKADNICA